MKKNKYKIIITYMDRNEEQYVCDEISINNNTLHLITLSNTNNLDPSFRVPISSIGIVLSNIRHYTTSEVESVKEEK